MDGSPDFLQQKSDVEAGFVGQSMWRALTAKGVTGMERWRLYQRLCGGTKTASIWFHVVVEKEVRQVELRPVTSVVTIVADYRKIVAEGSNQRQSIVGFHNRFVAENSGIF